MTRRSTVITLEEPYELLIYCSRYGCDWRLRDPVTKRFGKAPMEVYFICHKRKSLETKKGSRRVRVEAEMQGVCSVPREWIRDQDNIEDIEKALSELEAMCSACEVVGKCIGDATIEYLVEAATVDSISTSFSLNPDSCYIHIEEQYGARFYERDYEGGVVDCFG